MAEKIRAYENLYFSKKNIKLRLNEPHLSLNINANYDLYNIIKIKRICIFVVCSKRVHTTLIIYKLISM